MNQWSGVMDDRGGVVDNWGCVVDQRGCVHGRSALSNNSVESVNIVCGVVYSAHGTVRFNQRVLAWGIEQLN